MTESQSFPDVVELNVGGRHFTTSLLTLTKCKDTMLGAMFSGKYQAIKDQDGRYFIDADGDNFVYVLNYLRYGELPPPNLVTTIYREAVYFGLHGMVEQLELSPSLLAQIHRDSYRAQFTGYHKIINAILDRIKECSTKNTETTTSLLVVLFARKKKKKLPNFDKNHTCFSKSKNRPKRMSDVTFGPWRNKSTTEKDVMNCVVFDLQEKGFNITQEATGQCGFKCESPPENTEDSIVENCTHLCYTLTFHWWKT